MNTESEYLGAVGLATMVIRPGDTAVALGIGELPIAAGSHLFNNCDCRVFRRQRNHHIKWQFN
jgi:hypothetical protein